MKAKHILVICICFFITNLAYSQESAIDKGATIVSGTAGFSYAGGDLYEYEGHGLTTISLSPSVDYLVLSHFFIGASLSLAYYSQGQGSTTSIEVGPQIGYFLSSSLSTSFPYLTAGIRYNSSAENPNSVTGSDILLGVGVLIPMKGHIGFSIEGDYHIINTNASGSGSGTGNIISVGIGISGLFY